MIPCDSLRFLVIPCDSLVNFAPFVSRSLQAMPEVCKNYLRFITQYSLVELWKFVEISGHVWKLVELSEISGGMAGAWQADVEICGDDWGIVEIPCDSF